MLLAFSLLNKLRKRVLDLSFLKEKAVLVVSSDLMAERSIRIGLSLFLFLGIIGCTKQSPQAHLEKYSESRFLMWTTVKLDVCYEPSQKEELKKAVEVVWKRIANISWRINVYDDKSDVTRINSAAYFNPVTVESDTYQLIKDSLEYNHLTFGSFDITVWPLIKLWKESEKNNELPTQAQIEGVKKNMGADKIKCLEKNQVQLLNPQTKIDLSSITDGYAADEAARIFKENGFYDFLVDAGGELFVSGKNCEGTPWAVGVLNPQNTSGLIDVLQLSNEGVSTSGNYERYYQINGQRWSHIINPLTGYPQKDVISATVIAPRSLDADALSTALCVLGGQQGIALIDSLSEDLAALIIEQNDKGEIIFYKSAHYDSRRLKQ